MSKTNVIRCKLTNSTDLVQFCECILNLTNYDGLRNSQKWDSNWIVSSDGDRDGRFDVVVSNLALRLPLPDQFGRLVDVFELLVVVAGVVAVVTVVLDVLLVLLLLLALSAILFGRAHGPEDQHQD